ncbi:MAG: DUF5060 domain-containing protein [Armatimonadetes bacterium]|nr:DUF5060 domain-containing protein [Armatimonadota bacterium]
MRYLILAVVSAASAHGQGLQAEGKAFVWRNGAEYIRYEGGRWTAGMDGTGAMSWNLALWHDDWVYETEPGGAVDSGPALAADGSLEVLGAFSAREGSPPLRYTLRASPSAEGVRVRYELQKTAAVRLPSGVILHIFPNDAFAWTERVWARPSWHSTIGKGSGGPTDGLLFELRGGRSLCLAPDGFRTAEKDTYGTSKGYRFHVLPDDFEVGETAVIEYMIGFADMPAEFPGEVRPMQEKLAIRGVQPSTTKPGLYEKLELAVDLGATYDNPYDPDDVALDALVTTPSGKTLAVPGFFMVEQERRIEGGAELMLPEGNGVWKVRFTPMEAGRYSCTLKLRDRTGEVTQDVASFEPRRTAARGFVRQSTVDPHYFAFDNGDGYLAIGHNLPIYHTTGQLGDEAMRRFAAAKENYNRWWMASYGFGIEWMDKLGWYRQDAAARIDLVLDVAQDLGLYYMMCMDTHQDFREGGWLKNPFNAANGGPCATPAEWFTNEAAKTYYKKRLRYTVARWGYSPHVLCWEFGNEFEGWDQSPDEIKLPWHREMSDYLAGIDPFRHLITTSFWGHTGPPAYWELPNIDIAQTHLYTNNNENVAEAVRGFSLHQWQTVPKPHIFGEFGIRSHSTTEDKDPEGWGIHNALWAGLFSGCAGLPAPWWHENYIDPLNLYFHFTAVANFAEGLPFGTARWEPLEVADLSYTDPNHVPETRDAVVATLSRWGKPENSEFTLLPDGTFEGDLKPQELLQGQGHQDLKNEPTFIVNYPQDGEFIAQVGVVSNSGLIRVWIDEQQVLEKEYPCGEGLGKSSVWREQWKLWETTYDEPLRVPVPAGQHRIRIENFGKDWVRVGSYTFTGCKVIDKPNALVAGLKTDKLAILWLQNRDSCWFNHAGNGKVGQVDPFTVSLKGLPKGRYELEWWETWKGTVAKRTTAASDGQTMVLKLPALETDVAVKMRRQG